MADVEREQEPKFDPLVGEVIGIADNLGWPIERGEGVVFHFDGPNKRIVLKAAGHGRQERVTALWREAVAALEPAAQDETLRRAEMLTDRAYWNLCVDKGASEDQVADFARRSLAALAAECGRLREQLDAAQERAAILSSAVGRARLHLNSGDAKAAKDALDHAARQTRALMEAAALGVVGEQEPDEDNLPSMLP